MAHREHADELTALIPVAVHEIDLASDALADEMLRTGKPAAQCHTWEIYAQRFGDLTRLRSARARLRRHVEGA